MSLSVSNMAVYQTLTLTLHHFVQMSSS